MKKLIILGLITMTALAQAKIIEVNPSSVSIIPAYSTKTLGAPAIIIGVATSNGTTELFEVQQYIYRMGGELNVLKTAESRVSLTKSVLEFAIKKGKTVIINTEETGIAAVSIAQ